MEEVGPLGDRNDKESNRRQIGDTDQRKSSKSIFVGDDTAGPFYKGCRDDIIGSAMRKVLLSVFFLHLKTADIRNNRIAMSNETEGVRLNLETTPSLDTSISNILCRTFPIFYKGCGHYDPVFLKKAWEGNEGKTIWNRQRLPSKEDEGG